MKKLMLALLPIYIILGILLSIIMGVEGFVIAFSIMVIAFSIMVFGTILTYFLLWWFVFVNEHINDKKKII